MAYHAILVLPFLMKLHSVADKLHDDNAACPFRPALYDEREEQPTAPIAAANFHSSPAP